jgi:hypothetical protein
MIAKREKRNTKEIIRTEPDATEKDHYKNEEAIFAVDLQKEILCTGKTFRVGYNTPQIM